MAFPTKERNIIAKRANGLDEVTGLPLHQAEASHIDHSKNENYFDPENALFVNAVTHLFLHIVDEENGLTPSQNSWATKELKKRVVLTQEEKDMFGQWIKK